MKPPQKSAAAKTCELLLPLRLKEENIWKIQMLFSLDVLCAFFFFFLEDRNNVVTAVPYQQRLLLYVIIIILNSNLCDLYLKTEIIERKCRLIPDDKLLQWRGCCWWMINYSSYVQND